VKVKGKKKAVELIQLLERDYSLEGLKLFAEGRDLYRQQKWVNAIRKFEEANKLLALNGGMDGPCEIFIERCQMFQKEPPAADWDGSWEMDSK
jgi:adenylate cyclase